jgi:hypothetical protein
MKRSSTYYTDKFASYNKNIHVNVSRGYWQIDKKGKRKWIEYTSVEFGKIHSDISSSRDDFKKMLWFKGNKLKDPSKVKKAKYKKTLIFGGMNTTAS